MTDTSCGELSILKRGEILLKKPFYGKTKFYEKLPNPALIATYEFFEEKINFEYRDKEGNVLEKDEDGF